IARYIKHIKDTWDEICGGDVLLLGCIDESTVEAVQLRVPALSTYDSEFIQNQMISRRLFPEVLDLSTRQGITSRLLAIEQPIPTIHSLFKNLRYLEPAVEAIKTLIPKPIQETL
ncbi:hypothetical protein BJ875DRAFT_353675, partial [Amylocarpus encephaloides]